MSLTLFSVLPVPNDGGSALTAVLQRRGRWNDEKNFAPESWRRGCQLTACGRMNESDPDVEGALCREINEELGLPLPLQKILRVIDGQYAAKDKMTFYDYALLVPMETVAKIRWHFASGGAELIRENHLNAIANITELIKKDGEVNYSTIAMFPHDIEALRRAFAEMKRFIG